MSLLPTGRYLRNRPLVHFTDAIRRSLFLFCRASLLFDFCIRALFEASVVEPDVVVATVL